jgi:8-oxo-dGTP pyrophosphatase MutT (NUDIX family)
MDGLREPARLRAELGDPMSHTPAVPRHAATVVLLRDRPEGGVELFMVQRQGQSGFMANAYVYPGGKLDEADSRPEALGCCEGLGEDEALEGFAPLGERLADDAPLSGAQALGLYLAAVREVFEEAGVLLASTLDGAPLDFEDAQVKARFEGHREALHAGRLGLAALAQAEGLRYRLDWLRPFAHWITPAVETRRFNTRFFLALAPEGQEPLHDSRETVASAWWTPEEALERYARRELQLPPPTLRTLEDMRGFEGREALVEALCGRARPTILPRFEEVEDKLTLLLPGDALYPSATPVSGPTRVQLEEGRWWSKGG